MGLNKFQKAVEFEFRIKKKDTWELDCLRQRLLNDLDDFSIDGLEKAFMRLLERI